MKRKKIRSGWQKVVIQAALRWLCPALAMAALLVLIAELRVWPDESGEKARIEVENANPEITATGRKESNLGSLAMPMRRAKGHSEPCLKLPSDEVIEKLEFPSRLPSPLGDLRFAKQSGSGVEANTNRFVGSQTMAERNSSFQIRENMEVHCGFYGEDPGFDIDEVDTAFLKTCKAVVTTCNFGGGDDIYQPIGMSNASLAKVCYVAFWDEVTLSQMPEDKRPSPDTRMAGLWRVVVVRNLPFNDQRRNGKIPKLLGHRLFPNVRYSIWVDSKYQFRRDPMAVFHALLWSPQAALGISEHGARRCVYREGKAVVAKNKALPAEVDLQLSQYQAEGFPENATFNGHKALAEASVIVREHTPVTNLFMCLWFNEVVRYTARDQLSFPYVLRRFGLLQLNMFPVCTRKALVNSIGHKQKAKPLERIPTE
ncbi:uncharacterized protein LOC9654295 isoform X1 [Selaginella moellendorffii]|nr:uncharacterized protein LOC9654295 isoform X1 [Selaginella moellendorffii]XP_024543854.1 uncharacterized protein LOC9654295 isoform X1 [Selaginella moellendorffii]|eukprot:XP_024543853.1 uncharacterized protein LOC9654295 isoform X1 [Selaginella moellendorffii]